MNAPPSVGFWKRTRKERRRNLDGSIFLFGDAMSLSFDVLVDRLSDRLEHPLPGHDAHLSMAPRYSARRTALSVNGRDCREAGVLVLLLPHEGTPAVVLTVRREDLSDHAGQVSFPGGQREGGESLSRTALREANEEVNLDPELVRLLGPLTPLYIPPSNYCVHPFLGIVSHTPPLRPTDDEVEQILFGRLDRLLDPTAIKGEVRTLHGTEVDVPYYDVIGHTVWGATAMMMAEFLAIVREVLTAPTE